MPGGLHQQPAGMAVAGLGGVSGGLCKHFEGSEH
jgi:hypothetical protein